MLFSQPELAAFIQRSFEPTWENVRAAPQVRVDFGDGRVVHRTLHGNVVTWILDCDGYAIDAIGGAYAPAAYRARLDEALRLVDHIRPRHPRYAAGARPRFLEYHRRQADALERRGAPLFLRSQGVTKAGVELWALVAMGDGTDPAEAASSGGVRGQALRDLLAGGASQAPAAGRARAIERSDLSKRVIERAPRVAAAIDPLPLADDVVVNETVRRRAIHAVLAEVGLRPLDRALTERVYREALHCDLADPWLGLGGLLFGSYPFAK